MTTAELVRLALACLGANRLRAGLTVLGVTIGVAAVIALVSVSQGASASVVRELRGLGPTLLSVVPVSPAGASRGAAPATPLTMEDAEAIARLPGVLYVAPEKAVRTRVVSGGRSTQTLVVGTTSAYATVRSYAVWQGSFLTPASVKLGLRSAVVGSATADELGLGERAIGSTIRIDGVPFEVAGILQPKGAIGPFRLDDQVVVPITTLQARFAGGDALRSIGVTANSREHVPTVWSTVEAELEARHGVAPGEAPDFSISSQAQLLTTIGNVSDVLTLLLAGIASISLVVGGIGIMNIMLASVRERTREIGIRKAVGARSRDVLAQFLVEAATLSVLGGLVGTALGIAASMLIGAIAGWGLVVSPLALVAAIAFSLGVGLVFGAAPAWQAARLDPVEALRHE